MGPPKVLAKLDERRERLRYLLAQLEYVMTYLLEQAEPTLPNEHCMTVVRNLCEARGFPAVVLEQPCW